MTDFHPVTSHNIHSIGLDPATGELLVRFLRYDKASKSQMPGAVYVYKHKGGISLEHHVGALRGADSPTAYLNAHVKGNADLEFRKIDG